MQKRSVIKKTKKLAKKSGSPLVLRIGIFIALIMGLGYYGYTRLAVKNGINEVAFSQNATLPVSLEVTPEMITANEGDTFAVDINIDPSNLPVTAGFISLNFDTQILQYVKTDFTGKLPQILQAPEIKNGAIMFALGSSTSNGLSEFTKLATVSFKKIQNKATTLTFGGSSKVAVTSMATSVLGTTNKSLISNSSAPEIPADKKLNLALKKSKAGSVLDASWTNLNNDEEFSNYTFVILGPDGKKLVRDVPTNNSYSYKLPAVISNGEYQVRVWANYNGTNPSVVEISKITINDGKISNL